jgi:uncharacterized protein YheU (UPF0270 family)
MSASGDGSIEIPHSRLTAEALRSLVEEFVTRDGTDYGRSEKTVEQKVAEVMRQLRRGEVKIVFDRGSQTVNIVVATSQGSPGAGTKI